MKKKDEGEGLFETGPTLGEVASRMSRSDDPGTSKQAAEKLVQAGLGAAQEFALQVVREFPDHTSYELERLKGVRDGVIRKRLAELRDAGKIFVSGEHKCSVTGNNCQTWRAA